MSKENYRLKKIADFVKDRRSVLDLGCAEIPNLFLKGILNCIFIFNYSPRNACFVLFHQSIAATRLLIYTF